jgi:hypothetical protein
MAFLTSALLRESWLQGLSGTGEDTYLGKLIARVEARIARYLGYPAASVGAVPTIEDTSYTRYYGGQDLDDSRTLRLDVLPVTAISAIYDDTDLTWDSTTLLSSSDYSVLDGDQGLVLLKSTAAHGTWQSRGDKNIKATFTGGWVTIPDDIVQAAGELAKEWFTHRNTQGWETVPQASGSATPRRPDDDIPAEIKTKLDPFRLPRVLL